MQKFGKALIWCMAILAVMAIIVSIGVGMYPAEAPVYGFIDANAFGKSAFSCFITTIFIAGIINHMKVRRFESNTDDELYKRAVNNIYHRYKRDWPFLLIGYGVPFVVLITNPGTWLHIMALVLLASLVLEVLSYRKAKQLYGLLSVRHG